MCVCAWVCVFVCLCVCHVCIYPCMYLWMYGCMHAIMCACMPAVTCARMYVYNRNSHAHSPLPRLRGASRSRSSLPHRCGAVCDCVRVCVTMCERSSATQRHTRTHTKARAALSKAVWPRAAHLGFKIRPSAPRWLCTCTNKGACACAVCMYVG